MNALQRGFTLIELIIVISILGVLAAGLIAALDPVEQIKRGRDAALQSAAREYVNGLNRFYASNQKFPTALASGTTALNSARALSSVQELTAAGEINTDWTTKVGTASLARIHVTINAALDDIAVCALPESRAVRGATNTIYLSNGNTAGATCPNATGTTCSICFK